MNNSNSRGLSRQSSGKNILARLYIFLVSICPSEVSSFSSHWWLSTSMSSTTRRPRNDIVFQKERIEKVRLYVPTQLQWMQNNDFDENLSIIDDDHQSGKKSALRQDDNYENDLFSFQQDEFITQRRSFLEQSLTGLTASTLNPLSFANAALFPDENPSTSQRSDNFDGLLDLPPVTPGCARLYLCRHGQTENNRLHLVQGARVNPPLNSNGQEQAQRLGMALARLAESQVTGGVGAIVPKLVAHSKLQRARETAEIARSTALSNSGAFQSELVGVIPCLGEVDFGSLEGKDADSVRSAMRNTFAAWALGNIDQRPPGGEGESGRDVLERAVCALEVLSQMTTRRSGDISSSTTATSLLAVSHSTYLRVLLALVDNVPLAETPFWKLQNGSVNVVDVNIEGKKRVVDMSSGLFAGGLLNAGDSNGGLKLVMPEAHLIRRNEARHLNGMKV